MRSSLALPCALLGILLLSVTLEAHGAAGRGLPFTAKSPHGGSWRGAPLAQDNNVIAWKGIEYGRGKRFQLSQLLNQTKNIDALNYGPSCIQSPALLGSQGNTTVSEDCLFLNVYVPREHFEAPAAQPLPVVLYIHGGAFSFGSGAPLSLNPAVYTQRKVILVSINYRLNLLGFMALPNLPFTNFGLLDQRVAMEWVRSNILSFGGNPKQVTLIGDSAGAISILHHITSPLHLRDPLFHRGIVISAGIFAGQEYTLPKAHRQHLKLAGHLGCPTTPNEALECLLALPAKSVRVITTRFPSPFIAAFPMEQRLTGYPLNDRTFFPDLAEALSSGKFDRSLPLIIGSDLNEGSMFAAAAFPVFYPSERHYDSIVQKLFGSNAAAVKARYSPEKFGSVRDAVNELTSHLFTSQGTCQAARLISKYAKEGENAGVHRYGNYHLFSHHPNAPLGVYHTSAHSLFLRPADAGLLNPANYTVEEIDLSTALGDLFVSFARGESLDPTVWPKYDIAKGSLELHIGANRSNKLSIGEGFQRDDCDFFATLYPPTGLDIPMFRGDIYEDEETLSWVVNHGFWIIAANLRMALSAFGALLVGSLLISYWFCCSPFRNKGKKYNPAQKQAKLAAVVKGKMKKD